MSNIRQFIEKRAGEDVDVDSLGIDLGEEHLNPGIGSSPWLWYLASALPFAGRGIARRARGGLSMLGRRTGLRPISNWAYRRGGTPGGRFGSLNQPRAATEALTQKIINRQMANAAKKHPWLSKVPWGRRFNLEGKYSYKVPGATVRTLDAMGRVILPKGRTMQSVYGAGAWGYGSHLQNMEAQRQQELLAQQLGSDVNQNYDKNLSDLYNRRKEILLEARMPALAGTALGAGLGGYIGKQMGSSSRQERIRKLAEMKGISEAEAARLVGPDDSGAGGYIGAGLGGIGGYLLANEMYPPELSTAGADVLDIVPEEGTADS